MADRAGDATPSTSSPERSRDDVPAPPADDWDLWRPYLSEPLDFAVPDARPGQTWGPTIDTFEPSGCAVPGRLTANDHITVRPRSIVVLQGKRPPGPS